MTKRYRVLDAWRGIAALAVVFYHLPVSHALLGYSGFKNTELFVDFFFVLSGFVIAHAYGARITDGIGAARFAIRRFGRVWPLHVLMLAGFVAFELSRWLAAKNGAHFNVQPFTQTRTPDAILSNLLMIQSFSLHPSTSWNLPGWSISVEFYTYLLFAAVSLAVPTRLRPLAYVTLVTVALLAVARLSPIYMFATHDLGFARCVAGFFMGSLVARLVASHREEMPALAEIAALVLVAVFLANTGMDMTSLLAPAVFALVVYVFAHEAGPVSRLLATPPFQALGAWSYSIYMTHALLFILAQPVWKLAERKLGIVLTQPSIRGDVFGTGHMAWDTLIAIGWLLPVLAVSALTYRFVERPALAFFSRLADRIGAASPLQDRLETIRRRV